MGAGGHLIATTPDYSVPNPLQRNYTEIFPSANGRTKRLETMDANLGVLGKSYHFHVGDSLSIRTLYYPELNREIRVDGYGNIVYPFVGEINVVGLTAPELTEKLSAALAKQEAYKDPVVTINVTTPKQQFVHVLGEVRKPGQIPIDERTTLLNAIAFAGGQTYDAKLSNVLLIRGSMTPPVLVKLNLQDMFKPTSPKNLLNFPVIAGDVIFVPNTQISNVEKFFIKIQNIVRPIVNMEQGVVLEPDVEDIINGQATNGRHSQTTVVVDGIPSTVGQ